MYYVLYSYSQAREKVKIIRKIHLQYILYLSLKKKKQQNKNKYPPPHISESTLFLLKGPKGQLS